MNRKASWAYPSIFTICVLIFVVMILALKQNGIDDTTINSTINSLNWSRIGQNVSMYLQNAQVETPNENVKIIYGIVEKAIDFMGYAVMGVAKLAMQIARDNPNVINYRLLMIILVFSLLAAPLYYLFLAFVVLFLLVKEWALNRKEAKRLKLLKEEKNEQERTV